MLKSDLTGMNPTLQLGHWCGTYGTPNWNPDGTLGIMAMNPADVTFSCLMTAGISLPPGKHTNSY
jgi:hypothetical protein